ncbi:MAG: hypothetical protein HQM03_04175 [Magnetococcales bacterium]|nr:hypothetical protein [Magnetococcales bacterium]
MFPAMVGGDLDLHLKRNAAGNVLLLVVFANHSVAADEIVKRLQGMTSFILTYPVEVRHARLNQLDDFIDQSLGGVFLSEPLADADRALLRQFGMRKSILIFSPFARDVQEGITAGLFIATQVKPALNRLALQESGLRMNPLFLKAAKIYP